MKVDATTQGGRFGIFSLFTGAGYLDLGFKDAGLTAASGVFSHAETQRGCNGMKNLKIISGTKRKVKAQARQFTFMDLFAGCGGLSEGD